MTSAMKTEAMTPVQIATAIRCRRNQSIGNIDDRAEWAASTSVWCLQFGHVTRIVFFVLGMRSFWEHCLHVITFEVRFRGDKTRRILLRNERQTRRVESFVDTAEPWSSRLI